MHRFPLRTEEGHHLSRKWEVRQLWALPSSSQELDPGWHWQYLDASYYDIHIAHLRPIPCDLTTAQSVYLSAWLLSLPRQSSEVTCSQPFPVIRASLSGIALTFYLSLKCPLFREQKSKHTQSVCNSFPVTMTLPKYGFFTSVLIYIHTYGFHHDIFVHMYNGLWSSSRHHPFLSPSYSCWSLLSSYLSCLFFPLTQWHFHYSCFLKGCLEDHRHHGYGTEEIVFLPPAAT